MKSSALKDISKLLTGNVIAKLLGMVMLVLFARILSKEDLAVFPIYLMLGNTASLIASLGLLTTLLRTLPSLLNEDYEKARSLIATACAINIGGTAAISALSIAFSPLIARQLFGDPTKAWIISVMSLGYLPLTISQLVEYVMWARGQFGASSVIQIVDSIARPILIVVIFFVGGLGGVVVAMVAAQCVVAVFSLYYVRDLFRGPLPAMYPLGSLLRNSLPYYLESYVWSLRGDSDILLISTFLGPALLSEYYVAKTFYNSAQVVWTSIDKVAVERLAKLVSAPEVFFGHVKRLHALLSQLAIPALLLLVALMPYGIIVVAGARYESSIVPAAILMLVVLAQILTIPVDRANFVMAPPIYRLAKAGVEAVFVLAGAALLAPFFGISGVADARLFGPIAGGLFGLRVLHRRLNLTLSFEDMIRTLTASVPPTVVIFFFAPRFRDAFHAIGIGAVCGLVWLALFLILSWFFNGVALNRGIKWLRTRLYAMRGSG